MLIFSYKIVLPIANRILKPTKKFSKFIKSSIINIESKGHHLAFIDNFIKTLDRNRFIVELYRLFSNPNW